MTAQSPSRKQKSQFLQWFQPILDALKQLGGSGKPREVSNKIAENLRLDESFLTELTKTGADRFHNQVCWARQYLVWEGYLDSSTHGTWSLTEKGRNVNINIEDARRIFLKWVAIHQQARKAKQSEEEIMQEQDAADPEKYEAETKPGLLEVLQRLTPAGFEQMCALLLRESGFENVQVTGRSHDGGIDGFGTLEMNPFVSFKVLFQCKRYSGTVSRAQVGDFRNAMLGRAEKGIIITTGTFSSDAIKEANREGAPKVELVDGEKLVRMFEKAQLGVKPKTVYEVDLTFFAPFLA
ncbi:restriction endonuclease [Arcticibacter sp. MXS-1]|uniref:restriction endonuclease n=1 Tax=Arcticibacter sp. MXS-1 TaxID=3341726 RepID=UPI0035A8CEFA